MEVRLEVIAGGTGTAKAWWAIVSPRVENTYGDKKVTWEVREWLPSPTWGEFDKQPFRRYCEKVLDLPLGTYIVAGGSIAGGFRNASAKTPVLVVTGKEDDTCVADEDGTRRVWVNVEGARPATIDEIERATARRVTKQQVLDALADLPDEVTEEELRNFIKQLFA